MPVATRMALGAEAGTSDKREEERGEAVVARMRRRETGGRGLGIAPTWKEPKPKAARSLAA